MSESDPLNVIATETPAFSDDDAMALVREHYGLRATARPLVSERDQNFLLLAEDGRRYVFKIANAAEDPQVTDFQIEALLHIEAFRDTQELPVNAPRILRTRAGGTHVILERDAQAHVARIVTYIDGAPADVRHLTPSLCRNMGQALAHLGRALKDFSHPGKTQSLLWDLERALDSRRLLSTIRSVATRELVRKALDEFERDVEPRLASLRRQVIHSDFNLDNVLVDVQRADAVAGVIDFGDMLESALIADVAIGAAYMRPLSGNPLALIAEFVAGYHEVTPLHAGEIELLLPLVKSRLAVSVCLLSWRVSTRAASDPYLQKLLDNDLSAEKFLARLAEYPGSSAVRTLRQVLASASADQPLL